MNHRLKLALVFGVLTIYGCAANEEGTSLEIRFAAAPNSSCQFSADSDLFLDQGFYDPAGATSYQLVLNIRNKVNATADDRVLGFENREVRPEDNNVNILGFDTCWYRADDPAVARINSHTDGLPIECADLPSTQKGFIPVSGNVEAGGGLAVMGPPVLPQSALQAAGIFDTSFSPSSIPLGDDPRQGTRSAAWGTFPAAFEATVVVQLRAAAELNGGGTLQSNWFAFPIRVCPTCVIASCTSSPVTCADGSAGTGFFQLDLGRSCLPFQGGTIVCDEVGDTCP